MLAALALPEALRAQIADAARAAFPRECCGLIEGVVAGETAQALAVHPTKNLGTAPDRFEIDPAEQLRLLRILRGTGRGLIGCYHSHPNGRSEPSPRDVDGAGEEGFIWLIAALDVAGPAALSAHVFEAAGFRALPLV